MIKLIQINNGEKIAIAIPTKNLHNYLWKDILYMVTTDALAQHLFAQGGCRQTKNAKMRVFCGV